MGFECTSDEIKREREKQANDDASKEIDKEFVDVKPLKVGVFGNEQGKRAECKPDYTQIPLAALKRIAKRFMLGEIRYGRGQWKKGGAEFLHDGINHAMEHLIKYADGDTSEDHLGAIGWFVCCMAYHEEVGTFKSPHDLGMQASAARAERGKVKS